MPPSNYDLILGHLHKLMLVVWPWSIWDFCMGCRLIRGAILGSEGPRMKEANKIFTQQLWVGSLQTLSSRLEERSLEPAEVFAHLGDQPVGSQGLQLLGQLRNSTPGPQCTGPGIPEDGAAVGHLGLLRPRADGRLRSTRDSAADSSSSQKPYWCYTEMM